MQLEAGVSVQEGRSLYGVEWLVLGASLTKIDLQKVRAFLVLVEEVSEIIREGKLDETLDWMQ